MSLSTDKEQSNAQVNVPDQYSVTVHNAELKQDVTVTDNGSFKSASVKKETFSSSTDTACISYNLRPRAKSRELSRPFSSNHDSRNTRSVSCKPVHYLNNSEVSDVKQKLAIPNDNFSIKLSSVEAETGRVTASCRSSNFHSECDMNAHSCNLAPVEYFDNSEIVGVKEEILDCEEGHDVECSKEEMLSVSNVSCVSYVFQARNDDASSSKLVDSMPREDAKISDSSQTFKSGTVDSGVTKQPSTYKIIASRSCGLRSGIQYHEVRDDYMEGNNDDKNNKNPTYCKKNSSYYLRPRNTKTGKFTSKGEETFLSNYSLTGHNVPTKQALMNGGGEAGNQTSVSTVGMSCGGHDLRPRNNQGGGITCKEHRRFCSSGLVGQHKSANVYDDQVKQTSIYEADIVSGPNSGYEERGLHNLRPIGVPVRQGTMTCGDCTQIKHEILVSSTDVSSETYNLRPRNRQGRYSKPLSLQHREDIIMCSSGLGYNHKVISAEDIKQEKPSYDGDSVSLSYAVCSRTYYPEIDNMYANLELKGETDNDENDALKCSRGRSVSNFQHHSRNYLSPNSESDLSRNNCIKPEVVTAEDIAPTIPTACSQAHGQRLIIENSADVGSSMHLVTDVTSSDRNVPYYLRSRCIVKDILDQDLPFRQEIKEEGIQAKTVELPKTPLSSYSEAIPVDSFNNMNTRLREQDAFGNKGDGPCSIDNSVGITEVQNFDAGVGSSMHLVTDVTSSDRNIPCYLRSRCIVKDILDQDLPFRKEIKKEGIPTKTVEIPKTPLSSYNEAIPVDTFKNMNTRLCEQDAFENKGDDPCSIDNSVGITEVQNLEDVPFMNDGSKFNCSKESFCEESEQEMTGTYIGRIASLQEMRSVSHINENNFGGATCLDSGRQFATAAERNTSNENHCIFHNITSKPPFLQNSQPHSSCIGQEELQVFGDEKDGERMEFLESNIVEPCPGSGLQPCEKSNSCTEEITYEMASASGLRGSENNGLTVNKGVQIHIVEHSGTHDDAVCDMASKIGIQVGSPSNAAGASHTKEEKLNEKGQFRKELLQDLSCNEDRSKTIGTLQHTKIFPHNKTAFMQNVSLTWQEEITHGDSSTHNEQGLIPASNADMINNKELLHADKNNGIREQKLVCVDNTGSANEENAVEIMTHKLSFCSLTKGLLNSGNECKGNDLIHGSDDSLTEVNFDVSGPNTIEISALRKSGNDSEKIHLSVPPEVILPGIDDALTAEDFNVNGPNTVKISAPRDSFFTSDDRGRIFLDNDLQSRNDSDIDKMESCMSVQMSKLSPGGSSVPKLVVQGMCRCTMQFLVLVCFSCYLSKMFTALLILHDWEFIATKMKTALG